MCFVLFFFVAAGVFAEFLRPRRKTFAKHEKSKSFSLCELIMLGGDPDNELYGAWQACGNMISNTPTIWSFGVGCDVTFELEVLHRYPNAVVKSFDPTIDRNRFVQCAERSGKVVGLPVDSNTMSFSQVGLSNESHSVIFARSADPRIGSKSAAYGAMDRSGPYHRDGGNYLTVKTLSDLYSEYLVQMTAPEAEYALDVLKMDVEGSEFDVIISWCGQDGFSPRAKQILVEFHERMFSDGNQKRFIAYRCLRSMGYCAIYEHAPKKRGGCLRSLP